MWIAVIAHCKTLGTFVVIVVTGERIKPCTVKGWIRYGPARAVRALWKAYLIAELGEEGVSIPTEFNLIGVAGKPRGQ